MVTIRAQCARTVLSLSLRRKFVERDILLVVAAVTGGMTAAREVAVADPEDESAVDPKRKFKARRHPRSRNRDLRSKEESASRDAKNAEEDALADSAQKGDSPPEGEAKGDTVEDKIAEATRVEELIWAEREKKLPEAERAIRRRVRAARRRARFEKEMEAEIAKHEMAARRAKKLEESENYWQRFMEDKSIYEVEKDNVRHKIGLPLTSVETLRELQEAGILTLTTIGELRGKLHEAGRQAAQIQAQVEMYVKTAKSLLNMPEDSTDPVDPELVALCGDFFMQRSIYIEERRHAYNSGVYSLRGYPGFSNFFGRKQEELWYLMDEEGRVISQWTSTSLPSAPFPLTTLHSWVFSDACRPRLPEPTPIIIFILQIRRELLRADQGVLEFTSMGEMLVHKAALANAKRLRDWWTTDRWKWLAIVDKRIDSDSVARTEGMSGLMRILNIFKNIFRKMLEARSASDEDYDYPFELPYQKPHFGVRAVWSKAEEETYEQSHRLPLIGALSHNDVLPDYRMRTNMNKTTWYEYWFQEKCWTMSIPMIHIDHLLDTGGKKN